MKKADYNNLLDYTKRLEKQLRKVCNQIAKINRFAKKQSLWISAGKNPYLPLDDISQQGPLITELYNMVDETRKLIRKV